MVLGMIWGMMEVDGLEDDGGGMGVDGLGDGMKRRGSTNRQPEAACRGAGVLHPGTPFIISHHHPIPDPTTMGIHM